MNWFHRILPYVLSALAPAMVLGGEPALTIYNQNFAVVRDTVPLDLKEGVNSVTFTGTTAHLEPDSVILRDPAGKRTLQILEQNYRAEPISQDLLLSLYEGKTIDFLVQRQNETQIVKGKIVRSGYVPHRQAWSRYGDAYYQRQAAYVGGPVGQPIIEVDGQLRFTLPGQPLFPALTDEVILKPTLHWVLQADQAGKFDAELCYITGGMSWEATYNIAAPERGDEVDVVGWVTMDNQSGKDFKDAAIKLMAGDVSKIQRTPERAVVRGFVMGPSQPAEPPVTEKTFDEFHLYTLNRKTTLHDREVKQVEFVRASAVRSHRFYVYDGLQIGDRYRGWDMESIRQNREYGTQSNPKVWTMREFANTQANHLGMPLPKGRVRFYRQGLGGALEFTGENVIDHTPKDETVRVYTGNAFDLTGERRQTSFKVDSSGHWLDESFEIRVRNHKDEPVEVRVVEHLYRWFTWEVREPSETFTKKDSRTIEFRLQIPPAGEKKITYTVHYWW
jgi:hypothetical protein